MQGEILNVFRCTQAPFRAATPVYIIAMLTLALRRKYRESRVKRWHSIVICGLEHHGVHPPALDPFGEDLACGCVRHFGSMILLYHKSYAERWRLASRIDMATRTHEVYQVSMINAITVKDAASQLDLLQSIEINIRNSCYDTYTTSVLLYCRRYSAILLYRMLSSCTWRP